MPDSSDESAVEGVGLMQNDASDSETSVDDSGSEDGTGKGFLDVEASESGDSDSDGNSSDSSDPSILGDNRRRRPRAFFPEFRKLPIELRHRIWQYFCPDLAPSPRVYSFQMICYPKQDVIWEGAVLEHQIAPADAMLAVHRESREIALKAFPDTLAIREGRRTVRFNKQRDVVHLNGHKKSWKHNANVPGFSENVLNLALDSFDLDPQEMSLFLAFANLRNVYDFSWHNDRRIPHRLRWCASDKINRYEVEQLQKDVRAGEDLHFVYCWPDLEKHREFAEKQASLASVAASAMEEIAEIRDEEPSFMDDEDVSRLSAIAYWQMTCFGWDAADRFEAFLAKHGVTDGDLPAADDEEDEDGDGSSEDSDDSSDQNEYESDGIDDATIDGESGGEDEDDLLVDTRLESDDEDGGTSAFGGFSPQRDEDGGMMIDGGLPAAQFSSPEPESNGDDESDDEEETGGPGRGGNRRGPVVISDDEDEVEEDEKPSRIINRRGRVVLSDDEEEDEDEETAKPSRPAGRRARVLPSDDEDEDEDEDEDKDEGGAEVGENESKDGSETDDDQAGGKTPLSLAEKLARNRRQNPVSDDEDGSSEEEETSEEEAQAPPKKASLAQRLMAHRRRNPIESEPEDDSEGSVVDDDEDLDDEEEDDEDDENGMFMNMADEGRSDDEEGDEEY
ncbi:hypothetical protein EsH8_IX_000859 [Colletotrichum jinshuiense]